jgi:DNA-binding SARP family transcriptional activator
MGIDALGLEVGNPRATGTVVHLFGGPFVTIEGERLDVPEGSKRLLAFVALRQRRIERCYASGTLWPRGDDHRAAGNLRSALWRLRGAGIDILLVDKWSLSLMKHVKVDAQLMLDWAERIINSDADPNDLAVAPQHVDALDLLPGFYEDWAVMERERIRQRMLHALETLSHQLVDVGRYADAIHAALTAISADPLRESAQRALIEAHAAEANWGEARRSYERFRDLVRRELGVDPSRDLTALVDRRVRVLGRSMAPTG